MNQINSFIRKTMSLNTIKNHRHKQFYVLEEASARKSVDVMVVHITTEYFLNISYKISNACISCTFFQLILNRENHSTSERLEMAVTFFGKSAPLFTLYTYY